MSGAPSPSTRARPGRPVLAAISALLLLASAVAGAFPAGRPCAERPDCLCCASRAECTCPPDASCGCNASVDDRPVTDAVPSAGFPAPLAPPRPEIAVPVAASAVREPGQGAAPAPFSAPDTPPPRA